MHQKLRFHIFQHACLILLTWITVSGPSDAKEAPVPLAILPIERVHNRTVVTILVDHYRLHMALDTGATSTALFQSEEYEFSDLKETGKAQILFPALDVSVPGSRLVPIDIKFGDHTFRPDGLLLIHKRPPIGDRLNFKFDGILGQDFFSQYVVELDPSELIMRLYAKGTNLKSSFVTSIKLYMKGTSPHIKFRNKLPWEKTASTKDLLLDTGFPGMMIIWNDFHFRKAAGASNVEKFREENKGIFTRATFNIAKLRFVAAPIFIGATIPKQARERDGLIGANVLNQFRHAFDFGNKQLLLDSANTKSNTIDGHFYVPNNETYVYKRFKNQDPQLKFVIINKE